MIRTIEIGQSLVQGKLIEGSAELLYDNRRKLLGVTATVVVFGQKFTGKLVPCKGLKPKG